MITSLVSRPRFQSTHPYRVWLLYQRRAASYAGFNPHTHTGCDQGLRLSPKGWRCFNPHTHTGCDNTIHWILCLLTVSIHTPIQGVTYRFFLWASFEQVSIHTPIQGVTCTHIYQHYRYTCFNPHTHTGCDLLKLEISLLLLCFNPHTHTGCDPLRALPLVVFMVSIHTPIQGVT